MSTNAHIGVLQKDGSIKAIYSHWDGYPTGVGKTLVESYTDPEKVNALIELGAISSLEARLAPLKEENHSFDKPVSGVTIAYHRDRGEDLHIMSYESEEKFFSEEVEYQYLGKLNEETGKIDWMVNDFYEKNGPQNLTMEAFNSGKFGE